MFVSGRWFVKTIRQSEGGERSTGYWPARRLQFRLLPFGCPLGPRPLWNHTNISNCWRLSVNKETIFPRAFCTHFMKFLFLLSVCLSVLLSILLLLFRCRFKGKCVCGGGEEGGEGEAERMNPIFSEIHRQCKCIQRSFVECCATCLDNYTEHSFQRPLTWLATRKAFVRLVSIKRKTKKGEAYRQLLHLRVMASEDKH